MNIYDRIRFRREALNMTQEELAVKMGYKSRSSVNKIEKGENDIPQAKVVAFAKALDTTPAYLMGWTEVVEDPEKATASELSAEEQEAVNLLAGLDPAAKAHALQLLRSLAALQGKEPDSRE